MKNLIQAAVVTLFTASTAQAQQAVQWKVSEGGNGHWYGYSLARLDWNAAEQAARVGGGHLATITSSAENAFVASLGLPSAPDLFLSAYWTGGRRPSAGAPFGWITGEPWSFTNWDGSEPNGCCGTDVRFVVFRVHAGSLGRWDDTSVNGNADAHPQWSLIEWSADCNNDGIVDYGQCRDGSLPDYNGNNIPDCCEAGNSCVAGNYPVQWRTAEGGNGHWYRRELTARTWPDAQAFAQSVGAHLATPASADENSFIFTVSGGAGNTWIGGRQSPGSCEPGCGWQWVTGETWSFTAWQAIGPQPDNTNGNENHLCYWGVEGGAGRWNDGDGSDVAPFTIEWSADCNNDGLVDKGQILRGQLADSDNDGIPNVCECVCDVFRDFNVNGIDLGILLGQWGP